MSKMRVDDALVAGGFCSSRDEALRLCLAGRVQGASGTVLSQAGALIDAGTELRVAGHKRFVSRGGEKLDGALECFGLDVTGANCVDIGASSGGFTDCLLQRGAARVAAVDVAYGQFDWSLRGDGRVALFERTNIRDVEPAALGAPFDVVVCDISFSPLRGYFGIIEGLMRGGDGARSLPALVALVKPQFELGLEKVKTGVITGLDLHVEALELVLEALAVTALTPQGLCFSAIKGAKGNIEFFLWAQYGGVPATIEVEKVVREAHRRLA
jgi:23S rRNA (cytidine1920-2'-O)/16S rRNA (cytidine1409-2'-O)-methyltransferase